MQHCHSDMINFSKTSRALWIGDTLRSTLISSHRRGTYTGPLASLGHVTESRAGWSNGMRRSRRWKHLIIYSLPKLNCRRDNMSEKSSLSLPPWFIISTLCRNANDKKALGKCSVYVVQYQNVEWQCLSNYVCIYIYVCGHTVTVECAQRHNSVANGQRMRRGDIYICTICVQTRVVFVWRVFTSLLPEGRVQQVIQ